MVYTFKKMSCEPIQPWEMWQYMERESTMVSTPYELRALHKFKQTTDNFHLEQH